MSSQGIGISDVPELPSRRGQLQTLLVLIILIALPLSLVTLVARGGPSPEDLAQSGVDWAGDFADTVKSYHSWFLAHWFSAEAKLFHFLSQGLSGLSGPLGLLKPFAELNIAQSIIVSILFACLRICFVVVAGLRLSVILGVAAVAWARRDLRAYCGETLLGQTGNGRLFFSGVKVGLDPVEDSGAPATQVIGLACPDRAPRARVMASPLAACLKAYGAVNETNLELISVILAAETLPGYVSIQGEEAALAEAWLGGTLSEVSRAALTAGLQAHVDLENGGIKNAPRKRHQVLGLEELEEELYLTFRRVLTIRARSALAKVSRAQIATTILSIQAGKVLFYGFEGGKWLRKSQFGQLAARAVLQSMPSFAKDYSFAGRTLVRQSIIYGLRRSACAPVKMPVGMSSETHALRQWVECLLACPHELAAVADEVELFGLLREHEQGIRAALGEKFRASASELKGKCFATTNTTFVPLTLLCEIWRGVVSNDERMTVAMLVERVSRRLQANEQVRSDLDGQELPRFTQTESHVMTPLTTTEIRQLTAEHGLTQDDLLLWSSLRSVLASQSWLARRVGDYAVSDPALIFAILISGQNRHGLPGMVALRTSRFEEFLGPRWSQNFTMISRASMAENKADYERRLRRDDPIVPLDEVQSGTGL